jgi:hypothetical protein
VSRNGNCDYRLSGMTRFAGRVMILVKEVLVSSMSRQAVFAGSRVGAEERH